MKHRLIAISAALLLCILFLPVFSACSSSGAEKIEGLYIVCTVFPQYDFVKNIVKDNATVELLVPAGAETHAFGAKDISLDRLDRLNKADLFIYVGGETDGKLVNDLPFKNEKMKKLSLLSLISSPLNEEATPGMEADHTEEEEDEGEIDEHVWTSPLRAIELVEKLTEEICKADPENEAYYRTNAEEYIGKLRDLDKELKSVMEKRRVDTLIFADRFPFRYLCYDYNLNADAAFKGCSSSVEPSLSTLDYLYKKAKSLNLKAILYVDGSNSKYAEQLAKKLGGEALLLHSVHNISLSEYKNESYISIMQKNIDVLKIALDAQ